MEFNTAGVVAVVALVALAGCTGFAPGGSQEASPTGDSPGTMDPVETTDPAETTNDEDDSTDTSEATNDEDDSTADSGIVRFYISDERNAIGDFEHLNVTISEVGFQTAGDTDAGTDDGDADEPEETPENETETPENTTDAPDNETEIPEDNETEIPEDNETEIPEDNETEIPEDNETEIPEDNETEIPEDDETEAPDDDETEAPDDETDEADDDDESGEWVEYEVDDRTFDLTQLQGANASLLEEFGVAEGSYNKVFVHVEEINATLENGESVNVKLPSEKLQITQSFTVEANDSVNFVFDITVHKAGNSGKYILTPVISESGTDVPIEDVDEERDEDAENEQEDESDEERQDEQEDQSDEEQEDQSDEEREDQSDEEQEDESDEEQEDESDEEREDNETSAVETELNASFAGPVEQGENATVQVFANGSAVANATVMIEEEVVGETDGTGALTFSVPEDVDELEVTVESGDAEVDLAVEFEDAPPA